MEDIEGYEGLYKINREGEIWSCRYKKLLKQCNHDGYKKVTLSKDGVAKKKYVHRLLALQFIPNQDNCSCVDHKNHNRSDNRLQNLRWVTRQGNCQNTSLTRRNTSGYQGVHFCKSHKRWLAGWHENKKERSKTFMTLEEAKAYRELMVDLYYNRPNLPPPCISHELQRKPPTSPRPSCNPAET